jgi:hypothetical protein
VVIGALLVLPAILVGVWTLLPGTGKKPVEPAQAAVSIPPEGEAVAVGDTAAEPESVAAAPHRSVGPPPDRSDTAGRSRTAAGDLRQEPLAAAVPTPAGQRALEQMRVGLSLAEDNRPVDARQELSAALDSAALEPADADFARDVLGTLNRRLVFSPEILADDPFSRPYVVGPGDQLRAIVTRQGLQVDWRFVMRINRIASQRYLRAGQRLKLVTGPFHAVVDKSDFRLDLYLGSGADRVFVASYPVGLGDQNTPTPVGRFRVRPGSKLINPAWANPLTGERYARDDPDNPIGERWIGLAGDDEATRDLMGYGIHGTIEPDTIGREASMGCIRLLPDDAELIYEVLTERTSTVEIRP